MAANTTTLKGQSLDRPALDALLRRRMFYTPGFEIYGGSAGLFDMGPPGVTLQDNIISLWKKHFINEEAMLEVDTTVLTPYEVLKASGHCDKFTDWMCKDPKNGELLRADHWVKDTLKARLNANKLARGETVTEEEDPKKKKKAGKVAVQKLTDEAVKEYEEILARLDNYTGAELGELIVKHDMKNSATGVIPGEPKQFNLMFQTQIGPNSANVGFLRPETAQGQFLNFSKLLEFNNNSMPFASACVGRSYRNEISPRGGLLRVREFLMAEIEHFVDPESGKKHARFAEVADTELVLLDRHTQQDGKTDVRTVKIGEAVSSGLVNNETLGYYLVRINKFMEKIGVDMSKLRFRQHMANEMAHYAADCWDCELLTSSGWVECVGCADRAAYDLEAHAKRTGSPLTVRERLETPIEEEKWEVEPNRKVFGPLFKKDAKAVENHLISLSQEELAALSKQLAEEKNITITVPGLAGASTIGAEALKIELKKNTIHTREYFPHVIEPSFGIGRIMYSLIEHSYWTRAADDGGDEARGVLSFPPIVAPTKVLVVPLSNNPDFKPLTDKICRKLTSQGIWVRTDISGATIGKRYSRNDELGTPLGITIDFQSTSDNTVTLRDRDSMTQVRGDEDAIIEAVRSLVTGQKTWADIEKELPKFDGQKA
ncbi:Glycine--tRNA ligase 1, mitochondrial [Ceratocystis pirilliformis]|uniref:glycine--tRNA ligase n=1 Tax=Ceratocystis pirilliformis TaxID=259994 RepID=A0ABR3YFS3_9PEZI